MSISAGYGLFKRDFGVLRRPTARRPHFVRGMHSIGKQYSFIIAEIIEQIVISVDKNLLPCGSSLRGIISGLRYSTSIRAKSLISAETGVAHLIRLFDPLAYRRGSPWQCLRHPVFQRVLLRRRQFAGAAFVTEIG